MQAEHATADTFLGARLPMLNAPHPPSPAAAQVIDAGMAAEAEVARFEARRRHRARSG
jgi:hypothetical protein